MPDYELLLLLLAVQTLRDVGMIGEVEAEMRWGRYRDEAYRRGLMNERGLFLDDSFE